MTGWCVVMGVGAQRAASTPPDRRTLSLGTYIRFNLNHLWNRLPV